MTKLSRQVLDAGGEKGDASRRHGKWKMDYNSVDTQVLKTYLLKP